MRPSTVQLQTTGECDLDPHHLLDVFSEQRQRLVTVLQGFGPEDWAAPTRCANWSAHDVVRHLGDSSAIAVGVGMNDLTLDLSSGFDPRITPRQWLAASAGESPDATLDRLVATTEELLALARDRLAQDHRFDVGLPFGPMDWTILMLHGLWDSWIHERDVLLARGTEHTEDDDATLYATSYGVFIAAAVASMFGDQVQERLKLGGNGGGIFDLDSHGDVTLTVSRITTGGTPAAQVTDALAGRAPIAAALGDLPADSRAALSHLANFFTTPVEQDSA
jgi:uncharacterized protein (TIGR03083 family)